MIPCLFLINFDHIFFFHSQFFGSVIINNFLNFKEKPEWIHGNFLFLTVWFFEFLEMCHHFHLEVNLTALLSSDLEFNIFSFLLTRQILSWRFCLLVRPGHRSFPRGLHAAALHFRVYRCMSLLHSTAPRLEGLHYTFCLFNVELFSKLCSCGDVWRAWLQDFFILK